MRRLVLALASHTGWSAAEMMAMPTSRFLFWIDGLPRHGEDR